MLNKRYNSLNEWLVGRFGQRIYKVTLDSNLGCPNLDGKSGVDGCIFCNPASLNPATNPRYEPAQSIPIQLAKGMDYTRKRHGVSKVIAYFQNRSNTYAPCDYLEKIFTEALSNPDVVGLAVSTRPDCIDLGHARLFSKIAQEKLVWVEVGLQSSNDFTLTRINRGHTASDFARAADILKDTQIPVCAHVILGLPGETIKEMLDTANFLNERAVWGVKIHNLHVLRNTVLERLYNEGKITLPTLNEYADWVVKFLEVLNPSMVVHRVNSHSPRSLTIAPDWSVNKLAIFNEVEKELRIRNTWQGKQGPLSD